MSYSADEVVIAIQRAKQAHKNWGLLRFAMGWLFVLSAVGLFVPDALGWGIAGLIVSVILWLLATAKRSFYAQVVAQATEYLMFGTSEGQQAIRDEAARRLREGDY